MTMSPPPLPQSYYPPAYPAAAAPPAWPADPLSYRYRGVAGYRRPGIITAIAVSAIVVAALSFVASIFSGCTAVAVATYAKRSVAFGRTTTTLTFPTTASTSAVTVGADGLAANERAVVTRAIRDKLNRRLSPKRQLQLEGFLAQHGRQLADDQSIADDTVKTSIAQVGQEFATPGAVSPDFVVFKNNPLPGRLILKDDAAIFKPDDYSPNLTTHTTQPVVDQPVPPTLVSNGLDDVQAQAVLAQVQQLGNNRVSPAQLSTLNSLLQSPTSANWITDSSTLPGLTAQVKSAAVQSDGSVTITFTMGKLALDPQGNLVGPVPPAPTVTPTTSPTGVPPFALGSVGVDKSACTLGIVDAALSGLLAIYLFVVAILSLRASGAPRKLLVIYALVKIASGVIAIIGFALIMHSLVATNAVFAQSMARSFRGMSSAALTVSAIGIAYPIGVLLALALSKSAKDYYNSAA
jgi:hypothetical protein